MTFRTINSHWKHQFSQSFLSVFFPWQSKIKTSSKFSFPLLPSSYFLSPTLSACFLWVFWFLLLLHFPSSYSFPWYCKYLGPWLTSYFSPHFLCFTVTLSILAHGCHSCTHIKAAVPSLLPTSLSALSRSPHHQRSPSSSHPNFYVHASCFHFLLVPFYPTPFSLIHSPASHHLHKLKERDIFSLFMPLTMRDWGEKCLSFHRNATCRICLLMIISLKSALMMHSNMPLTFRYEPRGPNCQFKLGEYEGWIACQIYLWGNRQQHVDSTVTLWKRINK